VIGRALAQLADEPRVQVSMLGNGQDLAETRELAGNNPHVQWREWVPAADLPTLVADHDICLGIFGTGPKALRVIPNKVYQGAAAGCALITSDTKPQRAVLNDAACLVPPGDADAVAQALLRLARDPDELDRLRLAARDRAAAEFTPAAVVRTLRQRLADLTGGTAAR
jgi:glycosyltransferase involved in cell wall biosynthesis